MSKVGHQYRVSPIKEKRIDSRCSRDFETHWVRFSGSLYLLVGKAETPV
jgi:hypothetical protein